MGSRTVSFEVVDGDPTDRTDESPRRGRRRGRWVLAGVVAVVLALVAGQRLIDARARSAWDHLAERTDVVVPLGRSVRPLWTADQREYAALRAGVRWQGAVVTLLALRDGSLAVVAIDGKDGRHRWSTALTGPDPDLAALGDAAPPPQGRCARVPGGAAVACLVLGSGGAAQTGDTVAPTSGPPERLVAVDPADGRLRSDHRVAADVRSTLMTVLPGGLAVLGPTLGANGAVVVGVDLTSGEERWRATLGAAGAGGDAMTAGGLGSAPAGDGVAVLVGSTITLLGPDGAVRRTASVDGRSGLLACAGDGVSVSTLTGTLVVQGDHDLQLDGSPTWVVTDDGSLPGVVFTQKDVLQAFGPDGRPLWQAPAPSTGVTVLHGKVYVSRTAGVVAVDGSTGKELWRSDLVTADSPLVTDGRVLLAARSDEVVALDPATGSTLWRSPLPPGNPIVWTWQGLLVATVRGGTTSTVLG